MKNRKPKCYNCKHSSQQFKVGKLTHLHCQNEELFPKSGFESGEISGWDMLQVFSDTCDNHEFKEVKIKKQREL